MKKFIVSLLFSQYERHVINEGLKKQQKVRQDEDPSNDNTRKYYNKLRSYFNSAKDLSA